VATPRSRKAPAATLRAKYAHISTVGERDNQEDTCIAFTKDRRTAVFAVADGLGGHDHGELASQTACNALLDVWSSDYATAKRNALDDLFVLLNDRVLQLPYSDKWHRPSTTFLMCAVDLQPRAATSPNPDKLPGLRYAAHFAWAGDCTAMVLRPSKRLKRYVPVYVTARHGAGNRVTRCFGGTSAEANPQCDVVNVLAGDRILLVTDGFDEALGLDENYPHNIDLPLAKLYEFDHGLTDGSQDARAGLPALEWLETYTRLKGATDNATAILVSLELE
jgi:serine/threonine protein phosphatase PrpC